MEIDALRQEIDALIALLGDDATVARPVEERAVVEKIRQALDRTREARAGPAREVWETYLPYAAERCYRLTRLEPGWEDDLDYFASEYAQYCLDLSAALMDAGDITGVQETLARILAPVRWMKRDRIAQVDMLLQALDTALEISDKKHSLQLYAEAEKLHRKHLAGGAEYAGSAWLPKIKKMGQKLAHYQGRLRRYYQYAETVIVTVEAGGAGELERLIDYLQQNLPGKVTVTRQVKEAGEQPEQGPGRFRARVKFTLE